MLNWANIKAFTDSLGVQLDRLKTAMGAATEANSIRRAATINLGRIQAATADDAQAGADMLANSLEHQSNVTSGSTKCYELLERDVRNIENHVRLRGGANNTLDLQATLAGATERFSPSFAELYRGLNGVLSAANVYPPVTILGTFTVTGAGAGTFTDGSSLTGSALYGGADLEAEATTGATNIEITAAAVDVDGDTTNCVGVLNGVLGTKVNLVAANGKKITDITGVTITGGQNEEAFKIQTKVDRTPVE